MDAKPTTETKPEVDGPIEPRAILLIGGPLNGKHVADVGQMNHETVDGELYRRVRLEASNAMATVTIDVLAYWGSKWAQ